VAGVAALILSANPTFNCAQVFDLLKLGADDLGTPGWDEKSGWGRVNAYKSLMAVTAPIQDTVPPVVSITSPSEGSTVSGTVAVNAIATDNIGVSKVEFLVDGVSKAVTSGQFVWNWNTASETNGQHALTAKAYDSAGNVSGYVVNVNVNNTTVSSSTVTFSGSVSTKTVKSHSLTANSTVDIKACLSWTGNATLGLRLYNAQNVLIGSSSSSSSPVMLNASGLPAGVYRFEVFAISGKSRYTLTVTSTSN
ncbi:MAG: Ig-like domain-containing protein, partial [Armatimonadota bacterium]|nr:Ig-like domain-containing protein [Armatimonadota bacterium]